MKQFSRMAALLAGASVLAMTGCDNMKQIKHLPYPETARGEVVDNYFGTEVLIPTAGSRTTTRRRRPPGSLPKMP